MLAFEAVRYMGRTDRKLTDQLGLGFGDLERPAHRGIDVVSAAGAFSRPAQQARIKYPFGADQHQPSGFTAIPVLHGPSLPGAISASCRLVRALYRSGGQNTEIAADVTDR